MAPRDPVEAMIIERDVPITMDDGLDNPSRCLSAKNERSRPSHHDIWSLRQRREVSRALQIDVGLADRTTSRSSSRLNAKFPGMGNGGSRNMRPWGYAVIRVDSRGAGRSPGYLDIFSPCERRDYYHAIEWAVPSVVKRQGRIKRHLLLRDQPVARGSTSAATSNCHGSLGGCSRHVPRLVPPRWHPFEQVHGDMVSPSGGDAATRKSRRAQRSLDE